MNIYSILSLVISALAFVGGVVTFFVSKAYKMGEISKRIEQLDNEFSCTKEDVKGLHDGMIKVQTILLMKHKGLEAALSTKMSPRVLNSLGKKLFETMKGQDFLVANKDKLFSIIDKQKPQTAFDVENASRWACMSVIEDPIFNSIKVFVYNCPIQKTADGKELEVTIETVCFILSLPLRDMYLNEHKDIER